MIDIIIVEDNRTLAEVEMKQIKASWKLDEELKFEIFENAESFLTSIYEGKHVDILIADIELPGMNGIEMGKLLKLANQKIAVVFLTAHEGFALESYKMDAEQYVMKSEMEARLPAILNRIGERIINNRKRYKFVQEEGHLHRIDYEEVVYFFKEGKYVKYIMREGEIKERTSLETALLETGGFPFIKVERGYIVNVRYILKITENSICMMNGKEIPVSRRLLPKVKKEITLNRSRIC